MVRSMACFWLFVASYVAIHGVAQVMILFHKLMIPFIDIHTHHNQSPANVIAVKNLDFEASPIGLSSFGVHPWQSVMINHDSNFIDNCMKEVEAKCMMPQVVMIGETGLDAYRGADIDLQKTLFLRHITLSEQLGKPLVIHCVKTAEEVLTIHKQQRPTQLWIIHGYRKNAQIARQFLRQGIALSFGLHYNVEAMQIAYKENALWLETDDEDVTITDLYQEAAKVLAVSVEELKLNIYQRAIQLSSLFRLE